LLCDLTLSDKELEVVFRRRPDIKAEQFRLKMRFEEEFSIDVSHAEENSVEMNIIAVPELKNELNILKLQELGRKIVEQTNNLYPKKQRLETILLEGNDVFEENLVFGLMQKVAEIFAPTVAEIKKHRVLQGMNCLLNRKMNTGQDMKYILKNLRSGRSSMQ